MFAHAYFSGVYFARSYFAPKTATVSTAELMRTVVARLDQFEALLRAFMQKPRDVSP